MTVEMFHRMGLDTNLKKTNEMVCMPGFSCEKWGETAHNQQATVEGDTFWKRKKARVSCTECGVRVVISYIKTHMARIHGICVPQMRGVDKVGGGPNMYLVSPPPCVAGGEVSGAGVSGGSSYCGTPLRALHVPPF